MEYCIYCDYSTDNQLNFERHLSSEKHRKNKEELDPLETSEYYCKKCNYETYNKHHFKKHLESKKHKSKFFINEDNKYVCDVCNYSTDKKCNFDRHLRIHETPVEKETDTLRHKCDICNYSTNKKCNFDRHCLTHLNERKFVCKECGYSTSHARAIVCHRKTHETVQRPQGVKVTEFFCEKCEIYFTTKQNLEKHYGSTKHYLSCCEVLPF